MTSKNSSTTAPWFIIPSKEIVSVEHPCVVKDLDTGIETLQQGPGLSDILDPSRSEASVGLSLNPRDGMSRPLFSTSKPTNNMLLKVTVPKRTGRKRKRGSQDPYVADVETNSTNSTSGSQNLTARRLRRRLNDNPDRYEIEVLGRIDRVHVFRNLPDFVYSTTASPFMTKFRSQILPFEYEKVKQFDIDMTKGIASGVDIIPPPSFSHVDLPFKYSYRQNPSVKHALDASGETIAINIQPKSKVFTHLVSCDVDPIPTQPHDKLPPEETLDEVLKDTIAIIRKLFEERPAWTRRGLRNYLTSNEQKYALRLAVPYVGYIFRSGAWRDSIVKFGYDPRTIPEARIYQTLMFRLPLVTDPSDIDPFLQSNDLKAASTPLSGRRYTMPRFSQILGDPNAGAESHIFTGKLPLGRDGKTWMICDIHDPIIFQRMDPNNPDAPPPRPTCDIHSAGWYGNVVLATARAIMRAKVHYMLENKASYPDDDDFLPLFAFPAHVETEEEITRLLIEPNGKSNKAVSLASEIRGTVRTAPGRRDGKREWAGTGLETGRSEKRVRWQDEEENEEEAEEGEEAEEARQIEQAETDEEEDDDEDEEEQESARENMSGEE